MVCEELKESFKCSPTKSKGENSNPFIFANVFDTPTSENGRRSSYKLLVKGIIAPKRGCTQSKSPLGSKCPELWVQPRAEFIRFVSTFAVCLLLFWGERLNDYRTGGDLLKNSRRESRRCWMVGGGKKRFAFSPNFGDRKKNIYVQKCPYILRSVNGYKKEKAVAHFCRTHTQTS